jgi:hypothetical protein
MGEKHNNTGDDGGLKGYITRHMLMGVVLAVVVIVSLKIILGFFEPPGAAITSAAGPGSDRIGVDTVTSDRHPTGLKNPLLPADHVSSSPGGNSVPPSPDVGPAAQASTVHGEDTALLHGGEATEEVFIATASTPPVVAPRSPAAVHSTAMNSVPLSEPVSGSGAKDAVETHGAGKAEMPSFPVRGMAFVDAVIRPLDHELNRRFYGWRPNDILNVTDNVNNFQLGVLEVTRRTTVILAERISRTGSTAAFERTLENAMNWLMIKADRYWFPSAESKYKASLREIRVYFQKLERGEAQFFTRTDNLIPLLMAYEDLLGSCDQNLVKSEEDDGTPVSFFKSDDYFFYAKGVVSAMLTILEAIETDFNIMVSREGVMEVLHHAIASCHHALEIDPWIILNSDLSSIFANHRLNMAGPISHARFYLGVLIKALST